MKTESFVDPTTVAGKKRKHVGITQSSGSTGENEDFNETFEGRNSEVGLFCDFWNVITMYNKDWTEENAAHLVKAKQGYYVSGKEFATFLDHEMQTKDPEEIMENSDYERHREIAKHPIYIILGFVMSKHGFGFDISRFSDASRFKRMIPPRFLARILFVCIKSGETL